MLHFDIVLLTIHREHEIYDWCPVFFLNMFYFASSYQNVTAIDHLRRKIDVFIASEEFTLSSNKKTAEIT